MIDHPRTVRQAADYLNLSVHTIRAWIAQGKLGYVKLGRAVRIPVREIERVLQKGFKPAREQSDDRRP